LKQIRHVGESNRQLAEREREHQIRHNNNNFRLIKIREHFGRDAPEKALADEAALMRFRDYMNLLDTTKGRMGKSSEPTEDEVTAIGRLLIKAVRRPILLADEPTFRCDFPGCNKCYNSRKGLKYHIATHDDSRKKLRCTEPLCPYLAREGRQYATAIHRAFKKHMMKVEHYTIDQYKALLLSQKLQLIILISHIIY